MYMYRYNKLCSHANVHIVGEAELSDTLCTETQEGPAGKLFGTLKFNIVYMYRMDVLPSS